MRIVKAYLRLVAHWHWRLLLTLLAAVVVLDAVDGVHPAARAFNLSLYGLIVAGAVASAGLSVEARRAAMWLVAVWALFGIAQLVFGGTALDIAAMVLSTVVAMLVLGITFRQMLESETDDLDALFGAAFGYLLLAITWGILYLRLEAARPGSFVLADDSDTGPQLIYFSMVTLTTLGYGEITPATPIARVAAGFQAAFGTLYIAIFVGQVVGRVGRSRPPDRPPREDGGR